MKTFFDNIRAGIEPETPQDETITEAELRRLDKSSAIACYIGAIVVSIFLIVRMFI